MIDPLDKNLDALVASDKFFNHGTGFRERRETMFGARGEEVLDQILDSSGLMLQLLPINSLKEADLLSEQNLSTPGASSGQPTRPSPLVFNCAANSSMLRLVSD